MTNLFCFQPVQKVLMNFTTKEEDGCLLQSSIFGTSSKIGGRWHRQMKIFLGFIFAIRYGQGVKVGTLGWQNERNSSCVIRLAQTSLFGLCFMSVCLMKSHCYSLIYSSLDLGDRVPLWDHSQKKSLGSLPRQVSGSDPITSLLDHSHSSFP